MLTHLRSHALALMTAAAVGCGAPSPEDLTTESSRAITLTEPPGNSFERATFATVGAQGTRTATQLGWTYPSVSLAISGAGGQVLQWGQMTGLEGRAPELVPLVANAVAVSTSPYDSCAVLASGAVWCWNGMGLMPAPVPGLTNVVSLAQSGSGANCALRSDRTLWCWGRNASGELGDGTRVTRPTPVRVELSDVVQVSMGGASTCARVGSGVAYCWGQGPVGDGSRFMRLRPTVVPLFNVISVQTSPTHTCAVLGNGRVACWGTQWVPAIGPDPGQGLGTTETPLSPVLVPGLANVVAVAPGERHTCALTNAGETWCWGENRLSALGSRDARLRFQRTPVRAAEGRRFTEIHAGQATTCGREADGQVWCWGSNEGQSLGQPEEINASLQPMAVPGAL